MVNTDAIKAYMTKYFQDEWGNPLAEHEYEIQPDGVDLTAPHVMLSRKIPGGQLKVKLASAEGDLNVESNVTSLVNMPHVVDGKFTCTDCKLTSLEGGPSHVGVNYDCADNKLTSLAHGPLSVGKEFACDGNLLSDLTHAPKCQILWAINNPLKTLQGIPHHVQQVHVSWRPDLPLFALVDWPNEFELHASGKHSERVDRQLTPIVNQYRGKEKGCC